MRYLHTIISNILNVIKTLYNNMHQTSTNITQTFTGKERDSETGFSYFGARYYDSDLMTAWLSVDPLADKYPSLSPYAYCGWNPVRLVDPDGREIWIVGDDGNRYRYNKGKVYYENGKEYIGNDLFVSEVKNSLDRNRKHDYSKSTIDYFSGKTILESVS